MAISYYQIQNGGDMLAINKLCFQIKCNFCKVCKQTNCWWALFIFLPETAVHFNCKQRHSHIEIEQIHLYKKKTEQLYGAKNRDWKAISLPGWVWRVGLLIFSRGTLKKNETLGYK